MTERQELVARKIQSVANPWLSADLPIPDITVKEVSRMTGLSIDGVISEINGKKKKVIVPNGTGDYRIGLQSPESSGFKGAVKRAGYRSRRPGGQGPVVRRRISTEDLRSALNETKKERSVLTFTPCSTSDDRKLERQSTKDRLAARWQARLAEPNTAEKQDMQTIRSQIQFLQKSGLWETPEKQGRLAFRLSDEVLELSQTQKAEMQEISDLLFAPGGFLIGSINLFQWACSNGKQSKIKGEIRAILTQGMNPLEQRVLATTPTLLPTIARLDLLLTNGDSSSFRIVEIEGDKTHAFGYVSITDKFREMQIGRNDTDGIINTIKSALDQRGISVTTPVIVIVGNDEQFYLEELTVLSKMANNEGLNLITASESDVVVLDDAVAVKRGGQVVKSDLVLNIPRTTTGEHNSDLGARMLKLFENGTVTPLIPPARFLGSKGLLGLVSNGDKDQEVEEVLRQFFDAKLLARLRAFVPSTTVIRQGNRESLLGRFKQRPDSLVIKRTMSSGMKGVALPQNARRQGLFMKEAFNRPGTFVIQEKADQVRRAFRFSNPADLRMQSAEMFMRVSLFACKNGIATVGVTARETPDVHGAKDAIQIPVIFKND